MQASNSIHALRKNISRQMHSIEGVSLSEARCVPNICWALRDASFLVGPGSKGSL